MRHVRTLCEEKHEAVVQGVEIDLFYRFQAWMFGDDNGVATIALKVLVDIALYGPFIGLLGCVLFYIWQDNDYSFSTRASPGPNWYVRRVLLALITNWCVWIPAVVIIYTLPLALQLPVQNLILCFWVWCWSFSRPKKATTPESFQHMNAHRGHSAPSILKNCEAPSASR